MDLNIEELLEAPFKKEVQPNITQSIKPMLIENESMQSTPKVEEDSPIEKQDLRERITHSRKSSYRSRSRERTRRSSRERETGRRRSSRERERKRYRSRSPRRRSRSRERRRRSRSSSRRRHYRSRSRERRHRDYHSRSHSRDRYIRRPRSPPARLPSPVNDPAERDKRTVFCTQLAARLTQRELFDFLRPCGRIREARLVMDKVTRRSKGVGYVEFFEEIAATRAISLTGQKLLGIPIIIHSSETEKNRLAEQGITLDINRPPPQVITNKLYVGSLPLRLTENDLRDMFEPFGDLDYVNLHVDSETGKSKGYAMLQYRTTFDARQAIKNMDGKEIDGRKIKVNPITDKDRARKDSQNLDDGDIKLSSNSLARMELMAKLARDDVRTTTAPRRTSSPKKMESRYIVLKNMFVPEEYSMCLYSETTANWKREIEDDVRVECEKYGKVRHIAADPQSEGFVYLKFDSVSEAQKAIDALNGRYFAKKQISAVFVAEGAYHALYPSSAAR